MNKTITYLAALLVVFATAAFAGSKFLAKGSSAPAFTLQDQHEKTFSYQPGKGYAAVIIISGKGNFKRAAILNKELEKKYSEHGLHIYFVANLKGAPSFVKSKIIKKIKGPENPSVLLDWKGAVAKAYGYDAADMNVIVIDKTSKIAYTAVIHEDTEAKDTATAESAIKAAIGK